MSRVETGLKSGKTTRIIGMFVTPQRRLNPTKRGLVLGRILGGRLCEIESEFLELLFRNRIWGFRHQIHRSLSFWKCDAVADILQSAKQHHHAVDPQRDATMGRGSVLQGVMPSNPKTSCWIAWS